jgi:hypothetical protein
MLSADYLALALTAAASAEALFDDKDDPYFIIVRAECAAQERCSESGADSASKAPPRRHMECRLLRNGVLLTGHCSDGARAGQRLGF